MKTGRGPGVGVTVGVIVGVGEFVVVEVAVGVAEAVQVGDGDLVAVLLGMVVSIGWFFVGIIIGLGVRPGLHPTIENTTSIGKINCQVRSRYVNILCWMEYRFIPEAKFYAFITVKNV